MATEGDPRRRRDNLSALVATLVNADLLLLLTDQPGLFTADPRKDPAAQLIPEVRKIDESHFALAGGSVTGLGTGGMTTKLQAANIARHAGVDVVIAAGGEPGVVARVAAANPWAPASPPSRPVWKAARPGFSPAPSQPARS